MRTIGSWLRFHLGYRQRRLARERKPMSKTDFVEDIASTGGLPEAAERVWDAIDDFGTEPGFSLYPDDDLLRIIGIAEEDLEDDVIIKTCNDLGLSIPSQELVDRLGTINTPRDVVRLVSKCQPRQKQEVP